MPEVASRSSATRGRGGGRGGRGGFTGRGGRSTSSRVNGDHKDAFSADDEGGDIAELRSKYGSLAVPIMDMFEGWSEVDILYVLKETDGDADTAVAKILEGTNDSHLYSAPIDAPMSLRFPRLVNFHPNRHGAKPFRQGSNPLDKPTMVH